MCYRRLAEILVAKIRQNFAICAPSHKFVGLYLRNSGISTIGKKLLNSNISCICPHNMVNFGPLTAEIGWLVWGTAANLKRASRLGFITAPTSLIGGQPNFARCLAVWPYSAPLAKTVWQPIFGHQFLWRYDLPLRNYSDFNFTPHWLENAYLRTHGVLGVCL